MESTCISCCMSQADVYPAGLGEGCNSCLLCIECGLSSSCLIVYAPCNFQILLSATFNQIRTFRSKFTPGLVRLHCRAKFTQVWRAIHGGVCHPCLSKILIFRLEAIRLLRLLTNPTEQQHKWIPCCTSTRGIRASSSHFKHLQQTARRM
jgi:hypothetical protein